MSEELKIVIVQRGSKIAVGVQAPNCDPVMTIISGTMEEVLSQVPDLVSTARAKWQDIPLNPKSQRVPITPPPVPSAAAPQRRSPVRPPDCHGAGRWEKDEKRCLEARSQSKAASRSLAFAVSRHCSGSVMS